MTKFKKNTYLSLSLSLSLFTYLPIRRCTLIFAKVCACTSLSLSLSLFTFAKKRFGSRSDPNGTQERMFRQFKNFVHTVESTQCRTKADAHDKMGFQYIHWPVPCGTGVRGSGPPFPVNHQNIEYLNNTGPDPLKFPKLPSQHSTMDHHRHPAKRHLNGVSLAGR